MQRKPYAESSAENSAPILKVLETRIESGATVLEIGSGTGQHAVHFAAALPTISWQTSELIENHHGIKLWIEESGLSNVLPPIELDVTQPHWPETSYDTLYSANTAHIMPMHAVEAMFQALPKVMKAEAQLLIYGPFKYNNQHTSESNQRFDQWLKSVEPHRGVRDVEWLQEIAAEAGLYLDEDIAMPANNRILIWKRVESKTSGE